MKCDNCDDECDCCQMNHIQEGLTLLRLQAIDDGTEEIIIHKEDPPIGYSFIGMFETGKKAIDWWVAARKAGKTYPMWINEHDGVYHLWRKVPKGGGKMIGSGKFNLKTKEN